MPLMVARGPRLAHGYDAGGLCGSGLAHGRPLRRLTADRPTVADEIGHRARDANRLRPRVSFQVPRTIRTVSGQTWPVIIRTYCTPSINAALPLEAITATVTAGRARSPSQAAAASPPPSGNPKQKSPSPAPVNIAAPLADRPGVIDTTAIAHADDQHPDPAWTQSPPSTLRFPPQQSDRYARRDRTRQRHNRR
jgi:hypothetical protein